MCYLPWVDMKQLLVNSFKYKAVLALKKSSPSSVKSLDFKEIPDQ